MKPSTRMHSLLPCQPQEKSKIMWSILPSCHWHGRSISLSHPHWVKEMTITIHSPWSARLFGSSLTLLSLFGSHLMSLRAPSTQSSVCFQCFYIHSVSHLEISRSLMTSRKLWPYSRGNFQIKRFHLLRHTRLKSFKWQVSLVLHGCCSQWQHLRRCSSWTNQFNTNYPSWSQLYWPNCLFLATIDLKPTKSCLKLMSILI